MDTFTFNKLGPTMKTLFDSYSEIYLSDNSVFSPSEIPTYEQFQINITSFFPGLLHYKHKNPDNIESSPNYNPDLRIDID